jgi:D-ribose pyranase
MKFVTYKQRRMARSIPASSKAKRSVRLRFRRKTRCTPISKVTRLSPASPVIASRFPALHCLPDEEMIITIEGLGTLRNTTRSVELKTMLHTGILNPDINSLLSRVRHTNTLVIADRGFPSWPGLETIDLSLVDDVPTVLDVLSAILPNFTIGHAWMAAEFRACNPIELLARFQNGLPSITFEPHVQFKGRVHAATGLIRTAGAAQYSNIILESA